MLSFPRILATLLNIGLLIYGVYHIVYAKNLSDSTSLNICLRQSVSSIQWIGAISSTVAVIGIVGVCFKLNVVEGIYLLALLIATISTALFYVFIWSMLPGRTAFEVFFNSAEHGEWLPEYGTVMQKILTNEKDWSSVKNCFKEIDTCRVMADQTQEEKVINIDNGCCIPPNRCGLELARTGLWVEPAHGLNSSDSECKTWAKLGRNCFDCDSCKAGYLGNYHSEWEKRSTSRIEVIITLIAMSALAYYIFMHDLSRVHDKDTKHRKLTVSTNV